MRGRVTARFIVGDSLTVLRTLPDASVDLVLTSPPFLALRSYLPADHPDKALEMGSEATPGEFIDALLTVVEECRRVLAPHGSLVFELGDTYSGSGGAGGDYNDGGMREHQPKFRQGYLRNDRPNRVPQDAPKAIGKPSNSQQGRRVRSEDEALGILTPRRRPGPDGRDAVGGWPMDKSLCLVPELLRFALAYGFNPLTGRQTERWRVRNVVRWCRPNPPVGALADKFRPATSDMVVACTSRARYFDLDAVRVPFTGHAGVGTGIRKGQNGDKPEDNRPDDLPTRKNTHDGAPPLDWWKVSTEPYRGSHYATWPTDLLTRPILAMSPQRVCCDCGKPSERIAEPSEAYREHLGTDIYASDTPREVRGMQPRNGAHARVSRENVTTGWTDCGHDNWRNGVVLDPFAGSGTTLAVATGHGRDAIGIDLDERNADLARERVGMFLEVEQPITTETA